MGIHRSLPILYSSKGLFVMVCPMHDIPMILISDNMGLDRVIVAGADWILLLVSETVHIRHFR